MCARAGEAPSSSHSAPHGELGRSKGPGLNEGRVWAVSKCQKNKNQKNRLQSQLSLYNVREMLAEDMVAAELYIHLFKCSFPWEWNTWISLVPNISNKAASTNIPKRA